MDGSFTIPRPAGVNPAPLQDTDGPQTSVMQPFRDTGYESVPLLTGVQSIHQIQHDNPVQSQATPPGVVLPGPGSVPGTVHYHPIPHPAVVSVSPVIPPGAPVFQEGLGASPAVSQLDLSYHDPPQTDSVIPHQSRIPVR